MVAIGMSGPGWVFHELELTGTLKSRAWIRASFRRRRSGSAEMVSERSAEATLAVGRSNRRPELPVIRVAGGRAKDALRSLLILEHAFGLGHIILLHHTGKNTVLGE
jgi:hypothetical protein